MFNQYKEISRIQRVNTVLLTEGMQVQRYTISKKLAIKENSI